MLKIQNIKPFAIELKKMDFVSAEKFEALRRHSFRNGDIVMTKLGSPLGVSAIVENLESGIIVADLVRIRAQRVDTRFLCYQLNSQQTADFINAQQKGTTRPRVTLSVVRELPILVPLPAEQGRIVGVLDEVFFSLATAQAHAEKNLQNARALFESHLQSVFTQRGKGWVEKLLGEICEVKDGTHDSPKYVSEGVPFVTQKNIREDGLSLEKIKFISPKDHHDFYRRSNVALGDILISMIGANRGMACIVDDDRTFSIKNVGLVKQNAAMNQQFLLFFLKSPPAADYVRTVSKGGAQEFVGLTQLRKWPVPVPALKVQEALAEQFLSLAAEIQRLETIYQQKQSALVELKKSLLHQAFSGAL